IHILREKRHDLRRLRLEDLGELAASLEPLGVRRIVGKAEPLLPFDLHALAGPRLVTLARWPADARAPLGLVLPAIGLGRGAARRRLHDAIRRLGCLAPGRATGPAIELPTLVELAVVQLVDQLAQ